MRILAPDSKIMSAILSKLEIENIDWLFFLGPRNGGVEFEGSCSHMVLWGCLEYVLPTPILLLQCKRLSPAVPSMEVRLVLS